MRMNSDLEKDVSLNIIRCIGSALKDSTRKEIELYLDRFLENLALNSPDTFKQLGIKLYGIDDPVVKQYLERF